MDETEKREIVGMISSVILKKYNKNYEKDIGEIITDVLVDLRSKLRVTRGAMEEEAIARLNRRFAAEVEPMLARLSVKIENLISNETWGGDELERYAKEELTHVLREKAQEWARKVVTSEVRFKFDDVFDRD